MGLFKNIFGSSNASNTLNWIPVNDVNQLEEIKTRSKEVPCVIFKHSTRCSISSMALSRFESGWNEENSAEIYFLDLIQFRNISNSVAEQFSIHHQSPQVLIIKGENCTYSATHSAIDPKEVLANL